MNISFRASLALNTTADKRITPEQNIYKKAPVSFVKLNTHSMEDLMALNKTANNYDRIIKGKIPPKNDAEPPNYAKEIQSHFNKIYIDPHLKDHKDFFAITTQNDNFDYLDNTQVLGLAEIWNDELSSDCLELKFLQVNPLTNHDRENREFKNVGTTILNAIKALFPKRNIFVIADYDVIDFYIKNGFEVLRGHQLIYRVK